MELLEAGEGLGLDWGPEGARLCWPDGDWLGPIGVCWRGVARAAPERVRAFEGADDLGDYRGLVLHWPELPDVPLTSVRAYRDEPLLVFRSEAQRAYEGIGNGRLDDPVLCWPHFRPASRRAGGLAGDASAFGYAYTEFSLPTFSPPDCAGFVLVPQRPAVVQPLFLRSRDRCLLLSPLDAFHDQVIAVPRGAERAEQGVRCGWHGDLDQVPEGFASEVAILGAGGVRDALEHFGERLLQRHDTSRPGRYADASVARLSYWTDNGAAYWYRTEPGRSVEQTLCDVMTGLREQQIPVHAVELDSWFYPHASTRPLNDADVVVPPTGLVSWEPRQDALPDGVQGLRAALGDPPLILHLRHFSSESPYFEAGDAWVDGDRAHPRDPRFYDSLFDHAEAWGAVQVEHDWLVECFLGVRGLRERPGRARDWQQGIDAAAERRGLSLLWCMATPADVLASVELRGIAAIRSAGDYRYGLPSAQGWAWFLYGNAFARALGLWPFKDVFLSSAEGEGLDGDRHAELEALLAALSAGPVGIGDRVGRSDRAVVMRTCRADGVLVKPDVPLAALERCFRDHVVRSGELLLAETVSDHDAGRTVYLLGIHASGSPEEIRLGLPLRDLGGVAPRDVVLCWDWRSGDVLRLSPDESVEFRLGRNDWSLRVLTPLLASGIAVLGDPALYATAGDRRLRALQAEGDGATLEVLGAPGERPTIRGLSEHPLRATLHVEAASEQSVTVTRDARGVFDLPVPIGARGRTRVRLRREGA